MREVKHAREPWTLGAIENQAQGGKMQMINSLEHGGLARVWITTDGIDSPKNKANAERIVACVNACEGVSPEDLKGLSVKGLLDGYLQDDKAKKELEAELRATKDALETQKLNNETLLVTLEAQEELISQSRAEMLEVMTANGNLISEKSALASELEFAEAKNADTIEVAAHRELVHKLRTAIRWALLSDNEWINFRGLEDILGDANV